MKVYMKTAAGFLPSLCVIYVELLNKIKALYCKYRSDLLCVLKKLLLLAKKEETEIKESCLNSFSEILENDCSSNNPMDEFSNVINEFTSESAALLGLLIQVGRNVVDGRCKLAITGEERKKDFFKLIELSLKECDHFISFEGNHTNYEMCYALFEKSYSVSSIWLNKSLDIMEKCIIDE